MQYARIAGASVAAVDLVDSKLRLAGELGAECAVNATTEDPVDVIQALGGADQAIILAVSPSACEQAFRSLKRGGTLVLVGLPAENHIRLPIFETVLQGITVTGSMVGTRVDLAETFQLHSEGRTRVVRETRRLDDVNESFEEIERATSTRDSCSTSAEHLSDQFGRASRASPVNGAWRLHPGRRGYTVTL